METFRWEDAQKLPSYYDRNKFQRCNWLTHRDYHDNSKITNNYASNDSYKLHKKNKERLGPDWHYYKKKVKYTCNSEGYRAPEFDTVDWKESIVVFGCSMVAGIGVDNLETITHWLSIRAGGRPVINMGVPASGLDVTLHNNFILKSQYPKPWAVVNLFTHFHRFCVYEERQAEFVGPWNRKNKAYLSYMINPSHSIIKAMQYTDQIKYMWKDTKTFYGSFFNESAHYANLDHRLLHHSTARDCLHPGPKDNFKNAALIWSYLKNC
jgi:hypothetical protein